MDPAAGLERLDALFAWVVRASWQASVVVLLVLAVQWALGKRVGANWRYALWLLVAVRLAAPALPGSGFSLFNVTPNGRAAATPWVERPTSEPSVEMKVVVLPVEGDAAAGRYTQTATPAAHVVPTRRPLSFQQAAVLAWLAGVVLLCARLLWVNVHFYRRVRRLPVVEDPDVLRLVEQCRRKVGIRCGVPVLIGNDAKGPALLGLFRPRLLLPRELLEQLTPEELRLVFLHELAHLRRRDVLAEWVLTLVQTVHWFNPIIWLACARCRADRELACDEAVLSLAARAGGDGRGAYGRTILKLAGTPLAAIPRPLAAVGILEGRAHLKRRIRMIASYDSPKRYRSLLPIIAIALVGCVALTDAKEKPAAQRDVPGAESAAVPTGAGPKADERGEERFKYPPDWPDVTPESKDPRDVALAQQLDRPLPEVNFDGAAFHDVIDFFRDVSGANIFVNWKALQNAGIDRNVPVTVRMTNIKFSKALQIVLDSVGGKEKLGFHVEDGVITVSMADDLDRDTDTRVYDIRDLLVTVQDTPAPPGPLTLPRDPTDRTEVREDNAADAKKREALAQEVMRLIQETVDPDQWGKTNAIRHLQGQLIVTAPAETQGTIAALLDQMRQTRAIQLLVEMRFLALGEGALAKLEPALREKVEPVLRAGRAVPAKKDGEPEPAGVYLDEAQVAALLRALQGDRGSGIVAAPKIVLHNGQRSFVLIAEETPYVTDYTIVKSPDGGVKYEPRVDKAQAGFLLDTTGTVSADRKYVTLTLRPRLSHLHSIVEVPWEKGPPEEKLTVQRPKLQVREMEMTVSVPDGATLAAGGLRGVVKLGEGEEAPQERDLLMLVKPRIIVQREIEVRSAPVKSERR